MLFASIQLLGFIFILLRISDSNGWPFGHEPNELPTALIRDMFFFIYSS